MAEKTERQDAEEEDEVKDELKRKKKCHMWRERERSKS